MKIAISVPDNLFSAADRYAKNHGYSRNRLFAEAVAQYLEQHPTDHITQELNEGYTTESAELDPTLTAIQSSSIEKEERDKAGRHLMSGTPAAGMVPEPVTTIGDNGDNH
jgi:metal-responsive CopG/Arc/MetJ family transcriptional regulator